MPFKTKKRKLKASSRHYVFSEGLVKIADLANVSTNSEFQTAKRNPGSIEDLSYIRKDLLKIIIMSILILGGQILLRLTLS